MSVIGSYLLYYFIVISSSLIAWSSEFFNRINAKKFAKYTFFSALIIPVIISGYRNGIGVDYHNYADIYKRLTTQYHGISDAIDNTRYEPGWIALNYLVYYIFGDVKYVFILSSFCIWFFGFKAINDNRENISVGVATLILLGTLYNFSFNGIRQAMAITALMLSVKPLLEKKFLKFLLTIAIATMFHYTALIFAPVYFLVNSKTENRRRFKSFIAPVLFIGLILFIEPILSLVTSINIFAEYSVYDLEYRGFAKRDLVIKSPVILLILMNNKKLKHHNNIMYKLSILFIIGIILTFLRSYAPYINRVALYFDVTQVFIMAAIVKSQPNKYEKFLYTYAIVIYYLAWFTYNFLILGRHGTVPYQFL